MLVLGGFAGVLALLVHAAPGVAQPVEPPATAESPAEAAQLARAREVVARGEALFAMGNYDAALSEFVRAEQLLDGHPRQYFVLHNIALCHERMFRYDLALPLYERYLREAAPDEPDRAQVEALVRALRGLLVTIDIRSNVVAEVWVDQRHVGKAPGQVLIPAGRHVVELRSSLYESAKRELTAAAGDRPRLTFALRRLSTYSGLRPAYFWTGAALTGGALVTATIFGVRVLDARDELERREHMHLPVSEQQERVRDLSLPADICFGAAAVLGVTTTVLYFLTDWGQPDAERPASIAVVAPGAIGGRF